MSRQIFNNVQLRFSNISRFLYYNFIIFLFIGLVTLVSDSVNHFIYKTLSINVQTPNLVKLIEPSTNIDFGKTSVIIKKGDTLQKILHKQNISSSDIRNIIVLVKNYQFLLPIDKEVVLEYDLNVLENGEDLAQEQYILKRVKIPISNIKEVEIIRGEDNNFNLVETSLPFIKMLSKHTTTVSNSFVGALKTIGIPVSAIIELTNSYSHQIDFQRQIKPGDSITVIIEKFLKQDGSFVNYGKIIFASFNLSNKKINLYRFSSSSSESAEYFSEDGKSIRRSLLRTPINIVRISSHFGRRAHPILGYTKIHKGVDFSAPIGTPIYAAGNGIVIEAGWRSGYGKFIQIRHNKNLVTAYAHMNGFSKNIASGAKVKQGQVIGYVGMTGHATGPHLHYEVRINGKHVNPASIKTTLATELVGTNLRLFNNFKDEILKIVNLKDNTEIAFDKIFNLKIN